MPSKPLTRFVPWFIIDIVAVLIFAFIGRETHEHSASLLGALQTAGPFLIALVIISALTLAVTKKANGHLWPNAVVIWLGTVILGILLRWSFGQGVAWSFQLVTLVVLGVFLLGYRLVLLLVRKSYRRTREKPLTHSRNS